MKVTELTREQMIELKERFMLEHADQWKQYDVSIGEADDIVSDDFIFDEYAGYDFTYDDFFNHVKYEDLSTTAKIHCMEEFLGKMIPYGWDDVNDGTVADLEYTITCWIGNQYWIDGEGNWYDEGRKL